MFQNLFYWPQKKLTITIPLVLLIGFVTGLYTDTRPLIGLILPVTVLMIYPTMIGFQPQQLINLSHSKLLGVAFALNFLLIPLIAFIIGKLILVDNPQLFAGLAISALLPTSNMTIAFTMLAKGNVPAAIKLTVFSLILGSILAPWYLLVMVGQYIAIDVIATMKTIGLVVFLPMVMGVITYNLLLKRFSQQEFKEKVKPILPAFSAWGMVIIVFISMSINSQRILSQTEILGLALTGQVIFYLCNYFFAVSLARKLFNRGDGYVLVYSAVLRNLSISLGLAATVFGPNAAFMVTVAFLLQQQAAAWFMRLNEKHNLLPQSKT